jgi:nucleoside-diphosphate-sugar epimerase
VRALVLGGTGYLGRHVVAALAERGEVRSAARGGGDLRLDGTDEAALARAVDGMDVVVNALAVPPARIVGVTRALAGLAQTGRFGRLVQVSSLAVYGQNGGVDEATPPLPWRWSAYARAKREAEVVLERVPSVEWVVLRPGCLVGQGSPQWGERIATLLRRGRVGDLRGAGCGIAPLLPVAAAAAAVAASCRGALGWRVINLPGCTAWRWREYLLRLAGAIGVAAPARPVLAELALAPVRRAAGDRAVVSPSLARLWRQRLRPDDARAREIGGGADAGDLEAMLHEMADAALASRVWRSGGRVPPVLAGVGAG